MKGTQVIKRNVAVLLTAALGLIFCLSAIARAATTEELEAMVKALNERVGQQEKVIQELRKKQEEAGKATLEISAMQKEMQADARNRPALPGWLDNLKLYGDLRLRYQGDFFNWGASASKENKDRNRARFRLRFGIVKTWLDDQLEVGFRLATGESSDPTSTNQSMTGNFSKKDVWIDLAYAKYSPKQVKGLTVTGGKMKNPWLMNEIFMDTDVNPEGFWAEYKFPPAGPLAFFAGAGYFILQERAATSAPIHDTIMYGYQAGVNWNICEDVKYTVASYFQDYDNYDTSSASARGNDSPLTHVPGFAVVGLTNSLDFELCNLPWSVFADWARNCDEKDSTAQYEDDNNAYAVGIKVGQNKKKGDWSAKYIYAVVQANALPGTFVDADFGFANRRGHVLRGEYNILDNLTAGLNLLFTEPIFSPTTTSGTSAFEDKSTIVQADLIWKF